MIKSFLQTQEWLDFQKYIGRKTWRFDDGKIKANIIQHDLPFGKNYLYIPHGPEINFNVITGTINNEVAKFVAYLKNLAKDQKSIFIKIEPLDDKADQKVSQRDPAAQDSCFRSSKIRRRTACRNASQNSLQYKSGREVRCCCKRQPVCRRGR